MGTSRRLMREISKARERGEFTDSVLVCGSEKFPIHKIIVCSQSPVFHTAFSKPFKEGISGELFAMLETSPALVRRMVEYFYTGDYEDTLEPRQDLADEELRYRDNDESPTDLCLHARMFALADMYQVDGLKSLAVTKYSSTVAEGANIHDILGSIQAVYGLTPSSVQTLREKAVFALRLEVLSRTTSHQFDVARPKSEEVADNLMAVCDEAFTENPEFVKDLLISFVRNPLLGRCYNCGPNQPVEPLQMKCLTCGKGGAMPK